MEFTNEELSCLSNGLLSLIKNSCEAQKLAISEDSKKSIENDIKVLQGLNTKVCKMIVEE